MIRSASTFRQRGVALYVAALSSISLCSRCSSCLPCCSSPEQQLHPLVCQGLQTS